MKTEWKRALSAATFCVAGAGLSAGHAWAQAPASVDDSDRVVLSHNVHRLARPQYDRGRSDAGLPMERMILSLSLRPGAPQQLERLLASQQNPASPDYHRWLTPEQFAERFGRSQEDVEAAAAWLRGRGFSIDEVARSRGWINFSGTSALVEASFATEMHEYEVRGRLYHANATDPSIPTRLAAIVNGVVSLNSFPRQPNHRDLRPVSPEQLTPEYTTFAGDHYLAPADFATIYDLNPLYGAGIDGSGQTIAIVGRTDIRLADVQFFRSWFGLPANDPVFVHNGADPGDLGGGEETEADLDVEWSGAVAPHATIKFVISKSTFATDGVDLSAQYIVNNNLAAAMSTSFGQCEATMGTTELAFYSNLWSQAAAQGITSFVSSGDAGAAGCNSGSDTTGFGKAVSGLCSTPYDVCVGGSQFADTSNPALYWSSTNNPTSEASALSYIPELAWNESGSVSGGSGLWATGGGASNSFTKPTWQSAPGVPADGRRDVPDVSLSAAGHDGYLIFQGHTSGVNGLGAVGGTSASSPSFAGLMALVVQKTGARQGNANTVFYQMATSQYGGTGVAVFHDVTSGNNTVPGVSGFSCGIAYDQATGLGSVDGALLVNNWGAATSPDFSVSAAPASVSVVQGGNATSAITVGSTNGFNSAVALSASGVPSGVTASFSASPVTPPANGSVVTTLTLAAAATAVPGTFSVTVTGTSGATAHTTTVSLTVTSAGVPQMSIGDVQVVEGNAGTTAAVFAVTLSNASASAVSASWATSDGAATAPADYVAGSGTVNFTPGTTAQTLVVLVNGDTIAEPDETFHVDLASAVGATLLKSRGVGTILDDDGSSTPPVKSFAVVSTGGTGATSGHDRLQWVNPVGGSPIEMRIRFKKGLGCTPPTDAAATYDGLISPPIGVPGQPQFTDNLGLDLNTSYCYTVWAIYPGSVASPGVSAIGRPFDATGLVKWKYSTGSGTVGVAPPTVGLNGVLAVDNAGEVEAMSRSASGGTWPTGPPDWTPVSLGSPSQSRNPIVPVSGGSRIFAATQDGHVHSIDTATGAIDWSRLLSPAATTGAPAGIFSAFGGQHDAIFEGTSATDNNVLQALDPATGAPIAAFGPPTNAGIGPILGMPAVDYSQSPVNRVYFATRSGSAPETLWCLELGPPGPLALTLKWKVALGNISGSVVLSNGRVWVGTDAGQVFSIRASDGGDLHQVNLGDGAVRGFVFPDRSNSSVYVSTDSGVFRITDTGAPTMVTNWFAAVTNPSPPLLWPGTTHLYVGGGDGLLHEIDTATTAQKTLPLDYDPNTFVVGAPSLDIGFDLVLVGSERGTFYAVQVPLP